MADVLLIDDEKSIIELFSYVFSDAGHRVITAANGQEALERLAEGLPQFMVVDISMPVMDGRKFIAAVGELAASDPAYSSIPFVVMTGENYMDQGLNSDFAAAPGFLCFFSKMTPPETVLAKMNEALGL